MEKQTSVNVNVSADGAVTAKAETPATHVEDSGVRIVDGTKEGGVLPKSIVEDKISTDAANREHGVKGY